VDVPGLERQALNLRRIAFEHVAVVRDQLLFGHAGSFANQSFAIFGGISLGGTSRVTVQLSPHPQMMESIQSFGGPVGRFASVHFSDEVGGSLRSAQLGRDPGCAAAFAASAA
jgi:hypothetical protein